MMGNKTDDNKPLEGDWKEVSVSGGQHLKRMLDIYDELGFEVKVEEVEGSQVESCTSCYESGDEKIFRVYTRKTTK